MSDHERPDRTVSRREILAASLGLVATTACGSAPPKAPIQRARRIAIDRDEFVADCVAAGDQTAVAEVLKRAVSDPAAMLRCAGDPTRAGLDVWHSSDSLTILAATRTPQMSLLPHDHAMWALVGIYTGREDNILWRRSERGVTAYGAKCLFEGDVAVLSENTIHSVTNPLDRFTGAIHIYGGDFFAAARSEWNPETLREQPSDGDAFRARFERANEHFRRS